VCVCVEEDTSVCALTFNQQQKTKKYHKKSPASSCMCLLGGFAVRAATHGGRRPPARGMYMHTYVLICYVLICPPPYIYIYIYILYICICLYICRMCSLYRMCCLNRSVSARLMSEEAFVD
jgi:hypothetical protein